MRRSVLERAAGGLFRAKGFMRQIGGMQLLAALAFVVCASPAGAAPDAAKGNDLFQKYCQGCHGPDGRGTRKSGFMPHPQNLTKKGYIDVLPDEYLVTVITKGGKGVNKSEYMPSFETTLSSDDINDVIAFIRSLSRY